VIRYLDLMLATIAAVALLLIVWVMT